MNVLKGSCHCGRVRFRVLAPLAGLTECNCSICHKKAFIHWIVPAAVFELEAGAEALTTYTFNTHVARHRFCKHCGIHAFYVPRSDPDKVDVNARCLEGIDLSVLPIAPFDGRNWETAIEQSAPWRET